MKTKLFFLLTATILIQGCKKKEIPAVTPASNDCMVQKEYMNSLYNWEYAYDSNNILTSSIVVSTNGTYNFYFSYSNDTMITKGYNNNNKLISTSISKLNSDGNMISCIETRIDTNYLYINSASNFYDTSSYEYNTNKFLISEIHRSREVTISTGDVSFYRDTASFVIQNENITSASLKTIYIYPNSIHSDTYNYTYTYGGHINKCGQILDRVRSVRILPNQHKGKLSKFLLLTSNYGNGNITYDYTFDSNGNIARQTDGFQYPISYAYLCH